MKKEATADQLRAARAALGWQIELLANRSGVSVRTIIRYEDTKGVPPSRSGNLEKLVVALESAGIEFIGTPDDGPGIRLRPKPTP
jgi:transcriptional regulator with XRE-family HTH domain